MLKQLSHMLKSWLGHSQVPRPSSRVYTYPCPVCGYITNWSNPVEQISDSYDICSCCGVEFGYDDSPGAMTDEGMTFAQLRAKWIADGAHWFSRARLTPKGWDYRAQLRNIGIDAP